jgi:hypothetical protein
MFQTRFVEKIETHILCSMTFFQKWDYVEKYGTAQQTADDNIIRHICFTCWIIKTTDTHSECVIFIAFPWHHWLHECTSVLRYTYTASLIKTLWCIISDPITYIFKWYSLRVTHLWHRIHRLIMCNSVTKVWVDSSLVGHDAISTGC